MNTHDLSNAIRCGVRFGRLPSGRIRCHLQSFCVALSCLLLIYLNNHDLSHQGGELHLQMLCGELVECFPTNQSKVRGIGIND